MGWTGIRTDKSPRDVVIDEVTFTNESGGACVLDIAIVGGAAYVAWNRWYHATPDAPARNFVTALVVLIERGGGEVRTKVMQECMGPFSYDCPARILDALTPAEQLEHAEDVAEWRRKCREHAAKKAARPVPGQIIQFREPIRFRDGSESRKFRIHKKGRAFRFSAITENGETPPCFRLNRDWATSDFEVVSQ